MGATALSLCAAVVLAAPAAFADDVSADLSCNFRHQVSEVGSMNELPEPLAGFVLSKTGEMAGRGDFFNATDMIVKPAPMRRFIRAGHSGGKWFLWYERGGIAYIKNIAVFELNPGAKAPRLLALTGYFRENPCKLTDTILDGTMPKPTQSVWW